MREREREKGGGRDDDVMHFIVEKGIKSAGQTHKHHTFFLPLILESERNAETLSDSNNANIKFQPMWQTGLIWHPREEKRKEGGGEGLNSTSGFYQIKTDVESAAAAAFKPWLACYKARITITGSYQISHH